MDRLVQGYNLGYMEKIASGHPDKPKLAMGSEAYIEEFIREASVARRIIEQRKVTPEDSFIQTSTNHDTLIAMVELAPETHAMVIDFRGAPSARLIRGKRVAVPFFTVSSEEFYAYEEELLASSVKLTERVEKQAALDVEEIEDREFILHAEACVQAMQEEANGAITALTSVTAAAGTTIEYSVMKGVFARDGSNPLTAQAMPLQKLDIIRGANMVVTRRLRVGKVLIPETAYNEMAGWTQDEVGAKNVEESSVNGWQADQVAGFPYIRSLKSDILRPGNVYFFTDEEHLGRSYVLMNLKFWIDKKRNRVEWSGYEHIAQSLINVSGVAKIELYGGDATTLDTNGIRASVIPVDEKSTGAFNTRIDEGLMFPNVELY